MGHDIPVLVTTGFNLFFYFFLFFEDYIAYTILYKKGRVLKPVKLFNLIWFREVTDYGVFASNLQYESLLKGRRCSRRSQVVKRNAR